MLKVGGVILSDAFLVLFNNVLKSGIFPAAWKTGILQILHKSGSKSDPKHFRGICVSSSLGKLFNKILRARLEMYCQKNDLISKAQLGGCAGARTADHLLVIKFLVDKYVKIGNSNLYACFYDLKKAFDSVKRSKLFFNLLTEYRIGGLYLNLLRNLYKDNKIFVQTSMGLIEPFVTTAGVLQGDILSPILFNLFVGKTPDVIDSTCDPVSIGPNKSSCLLWCDDLVVFSTTPKGLQNAINKIALHFQSLGLEVNKTKTKVIIVNKRCLSLSDRPEHYFYLDGKKLDVVNEYQYLGLKLKSSGTLSVAADELHTKASRVYFSKGNILYNHKKWPVERAMGMFDTIVAPVSLYACELWAPLVLPKKTFRNLDSLMAAWQTFQPELLNSKVCRLLLGVHRKANRLAILGELGRYPLLMKAITHALKYEWHLENVISKSSLAFLALQEMKHTSSTEDSWYSRIKSIKQILDIPSFNAQCKPDTVGKRIKSIVESKFSIFWKNQI